MTSHFIPFHDAKMLHSSFLSIFFVFLLTNPAKSVDIINQTCQKCSLESPTLNYNLCSQSLQAIPLSHATNLQGLALIAMELAIKNATSTISSIQTMLNSGGFDAFSLACLANCKELYSNAVMMLVNCFEGFLFENYYSVDVWIRGVMEATTTCEEGFIEKKGEVSPLTNENYNLFQICDIVLCIDRSLLNNQTVLYISY